jgi:hypothetical protein
MDMPNMSCCGLVDMIYVSSEFLLRTRGCTNVEMDHNMSHVNNSRNSNPYIGVTCESLSSLFVQVVSKTWEDYKVEKL